MYLYSECLAYRLGYCPPIQEQVMLPSMVLIDHWSLIRWLFESKSARLTVDLLYLVMTGIPNILVSNVYGLVLVN